MNKENLNIVYINIDDLRFAEYNPRKANKEQFEQLKKSLSQFGFDKSDNFTGRFYFYKNLINIKIGKNIKFPVYSWYKKVKLNNYKEVFDFILAHELTHWFQKQLGLPYNEYIADNVGKEVISMKNYVCGGGGASGGGGSRGGRSTASKSRGGKGKSSRGGRRR